MKPSRRTFLHLSATAAALRAVSPKAWAQGYPARPVRVIVPFAAGGQADVIARLIAQRLSAQLAQQFYVENAPGGGGTIGTGRAAQASPDGYTILVQDGIAFTANPSLYVKVPYDATRDFDPVTIPATTMQVLAVHPSVEARTIQELVALIKANPGKYSYASAGVGTGAHLTGELFRNSLGLDLVHVPYNSGAQAIAAAVGGHTPISFGSPAATIPQVKDGNLRALAVGGKKRVRELPDIPTMREVGFPDVGTIAWQGMFAPAGTPKEIIETLQKASIQAMDVPAARKVFAEQSFNIVPTKSIEEAKSWLAQEMATWSRITQEVKIEVPE